MLVDECLIIKKNSKYVMIYNDYDDSIGFVKTFKNLESVIEYMKKIQNGFNPLREDDPSDGSGIDVKEYALQFLPQSIDELDRISIYDMGVALKEEGNKIAEALKESM
jgi:hypothetical protein